MPRATCPCAQCSDVCSTLMCEVSRCVQYPDGRPAALLRLLREREACVVAMDHVPPPATPPPPPPPARPRSHSRRSSTSSRRSSISSRASSEYCHVPLPAAAEAEAAAREENHITEPQVLLNMNIY